MSKNGDKCLSCFQSQSDVLQLLTYSDQPKNLKYSIYNMKLGKAAKVQFEKLEQADTETMAMKWKRDEDTSPEGHTTRSNTSD